MTTQSMIEISRALYGIATEVSLSSRVMTGVKVISTTVLPSVIRDSANLGLLPASWS